ncbi:hypothetical protein [Rhodoferax sp.]|uniref:hypothetical protein n=1 Tax=Rhodoferax sp. TaxID=50421 RepID=UPI0019D9EDC7|nr:hypothetical protein [Rhodoferax sp.]MBE0474230.1 hypothetical protein [Rhodoferax sp.]
MAERQKVGVLEQTRHGFAGVMVALATLAIVLSLGLLAFAPLGALAQLGVAAAFSCVMRKAL